MRDLSEPPDCFHPLAAARRSRHYSDSLPTPVLALPMNIVTCTHDRHAAEILAIFNEAIVTSTALFDYLPRTPAAMVAWFEGKQGGNYPVIGVEGCDGQLLGFASRVG